MNRARIDSGLVQDVILGCVSHIGVQTYNIGSNSRFPYSYVPGTTIDLPMWLWPAAGNSFCSSGEIMSGDMDIVAGGVESMPRVPMGSSLQRR